MLLYVECGYVEPGYIEGDDICARIPGGGYRKPIKVRKKPKAEKSDMGIPISAIPDVSRIVNILVKEGVARDQAKAVAETQAVLASANEQVMALKVREREKAMLKDIRRMLDDMDDEDAIFLMGMV